MANFSDVQRGNFGKELFTKIESSKVLVVGAGGIGCELLKTLVLTGFKDIEVIDLDTIDVSNLNRQFLFQKQHVGKSKASVARESAIEFNPEVKIKAYHDSIISSEYNLRFFKRFTIVLNALDNRTARNHVNRMCLAADIPLVESGTAGYLGQVTLIKKGVTECYECQPKPHQKSFPGCTIRNTPSAPIHCIVWAKHLFNQLFGEADVDEEVSPDAADPEAIGNAGMAATNSSSMEINRISTQDWAKSINYEPAKLIEKFFIEDIKYLLSMDKLWKERKPPVPLNLANLDEKSSAICQDGLLDQKIWTVKECVEYFSRSIRLLQKELTSKDDYLIWDKDSDASLDFVVSASNIRAHIFDITKKSRFDVKSMAGNIIPAIATTNAAIAGLIVLEALKAIENKIKKCCTVYLNKKPSVRKKLLQPSPLVAPNPKCYVCASKPEAKVMLDCDRMTVKSFEEKVLKQTFGVIAPDVEIDNGKGTILISSEEGETIQNNSKVLSDFGISDCSRLRIDDFLQDYELVLNIVNSSSMSDDDHFKILEDVEKDEEKSVTKINTEEIDTSIVLPSMDVSNKESNFDQACRKRKADDSPQTENNDGRKHARIDLTNDDEIVSLVHSNGSFMDEEERVDTLEVIDVDALQQNDAPVVMVLDHEDSVQPRDLVTPVEKNGERSKPDVVVLDD